MNAKSIRTAAAITCIATLIVAASSASSASSAASASTRSTGVVHTNVLRWR